MGKTLGYDDAYYIGIDTGVNTGMAIYHKGEFLDIITTDIISALDRIREMSESGLEVKVYIEDARLRKYFGRESREKVEAKKQGAGSVKRDSKIWDDTLTNLGIEHYMISPKDNSTKMRAEYFKLITGYKGKTNEHNRDAAMLVFQRGKGRFY